ncbi:MAG TPA: CDP-alcohol phosphatidyltransferase family protein [Gemmatimonadaceae bacterium]|nr:CDP-alcohol phosphatidyltransferase family protein [Gemmatimonadaceae bacterium]
MNLPNALTVGRIIAAPLVAYLPFVQRWDARALAFVLFVLVAVTDYFDGKLARTRGLVTDTGKLLDPLADKLLLLATFVPMWVLVGSGLSLSLWAPYHSYYYPGIVGPMGDPQSGHPVFPYITPIGALGLPLWIIAIVLGREVFMTVFRQVAARRGTIIAASNVAKWKTGFQWTWVGASFFWFSAATAAAQYSWTHPAWVAFAQFNGLVCVLTMAFAVALTVWSLWAYLREFGGLMGRVG